MYINYEILNRESVINSYQWYLSLQIKHVIEKGYYNINVSWWKLETRTINMRALHKWWYNHNIQ